MRARDIDRCWHHSGSAAAMSRWRGLRRCGKALPPKLFHQIHVSTLLAAHINQIFVLPRIDNRTWASEQGGSGNATTPLLSLMS